GAQAAQALRSGQVAAYVAPRGQIAQIEHRAGPVRPLPLPPRLREVFGPGLFARREFLEKNRSTAVGIGRAVAKSTLFLLNNPEAAIRRHRKAHPAQVPQGVSQEQALQDALKVLRVQTEVLRFQEHGTARQFGYYRPESLTALLDVFGWSDKVSDPQRYFT